MPNILLVDDEPRQLAMSTIIKSLRPHYKYVHGTGWQ